MLRDHLEYLVRDGLIGVAAHRELEFFFRHGLIQDAAYSTLLKPQRLAWHRAAGEVLEAQLQSSPAPEAVQSLAPLLAQHFSIAGDDERAIRYFTRAAEAAFQRYANEEASDYYARAFALATRDGAVYDPGLVLALTLGYGRALELRSQFEAALRHYEAAGALAQRHADRTLELATLVERAKILSTVNLSSDPEQSRALLEQAAPLAENLGDHATEARLYWTLMLQNTMRGGDLDERIAYGERSLAVARQLRLREQLAYTHQDLYFGYGGRCQWQQARATLLEARRLWRELDNPVGESEVVLRLSQVAMFTGDYDESVAAVDEGHRLAHTSNSADMQALSHAFVGLIHAERGDYAQACALAEAAVAVGETTGNVTVLAGTQADLGWAFGELGAAGQGLALAQAARTVAETRFPLLTPWPAASVARLHLLRGDVAEAGDALAAQPPYPEVQRRTGFLVMMWLNVALAEAELALARGQASEAAAVMAEVAEGMQATGTRFHLPDVLYLRGQALLAQGRLTQARSELQAARLEALALGSRRMLWRILAALAEVESQTGQAERAAAWRREAQPEVAYIASHAPTPELRDSFLSLPSVQAVLHST